MGIEFNKTDKVYYYKGKLRPGSMLFPEMIEGAEQILVERYGAVSYLGKEFLVDSMSTVEFMGAQFIEGQYHLLYKSGERFFWKDAEGNVVLPPSLIEVGMPVLHTSGVAGVVEALSKNIATVRTRSGAINYYKKSLRPFRLKGENSITEYANAVNKFEACFPAIAAELKKENTLLLKGAFDETLTKLKEHNPEIKTTEELKNPAPSPEPPPTPSPKPSFFQRIFKRKTASPAPSPEPPPQTMENKPVVSSPEHLGKDYKTIHGVPNTAGKDVHRLTHIDLNPYSRNDDDKHLYHYEVGEHRDPIVTTKYLGSDGKEAKPHDFIKSGVYVPGEMVRHQKRDYQVVSHVDYNPKTNQHNFKNMLVKDKSGDIISVPRNEVQLTSNDFSKHATVSLTNGERKFQHQLKPGDTLMHDGAEHYIVHHDPLRGYISQNKQTGKLHFHSPKDFDKEYLAKDKPYRVQKGDKVKLGSNKFRVEGESGTKGKSIISIVDEKNSRRFYEVDTDLLHDKVVKQREMKPLKLDDFSDADISKVPSAKDILSRSIVAPETSNTPFTQTPTPQPKKEELLKNHIDLMDEKLGEFRKEEKDGEVHHRLGVGDLGIKTSIGDDNVIRSEIQNPEIQLGSKPKRLIVKDYDPATDTIKFRAKGDSPTKKLQEMKLGEFKTWIKENEKDLHDEPTIKANLQNVEDKFHEKAVEHIAKHMMVQGKDKPSPQEIQEELNNPESHLRRKLDSEVSKFESEYHKTKAGGSSIESDDFEKMGDANKVLDGAFDDEKGMTSDIHSKIKELKTNRENQEKYEKSQAKRKEILDAQRKTVDENKKKEELPEKEYIENTYNKLDDLFSKSISNKAGVKSADHNISVKSDKHDNTSAEFHILEANDLHTSDNITDKHASRHKDGLEGLHKIPFLKNENFPPTGAQLRDYSSETPEAESARKFTIENVADNFKPEEIINPSPQGNTNAPIVDSKGVVMGGNGRVLASRLLSPENIQKNKEVIKSKLKQFYPDASDAQIKKLESGIDKAKNPVMVRLAKHSSGDYYDYGKHNEDYKDFTRVLNSESTKAQSERAKAEGIASALSTKKREDLYKMIPQGTNINKHISNLKNAHQILDKLQEHKLITPDERAVLTDEKGLTNEGKRIITDVFQRGYFSKEGEHAIGKLTAEHRDKVNDFKNTHIGALLNLKTENPQFDLRSNIEDTARSFRDDSTQLEGQTKVQEDSIPTKGLKYIMTLPVDEQREIMDKYNKDVRNISETLKGNSLFGDITDTEKDPNKFKDAFFEKWAKYHDHLQERKLKKEFPNPFIKGLGIKQGFDLIKSAKVVNISSVAVMDDQGRILMGRRRDSNLWTLPGGHAEPGETELEAAVRELEEETGIKADPKRMRKLGEEEIISETGRPIKVAAFKYTGNEKTSMQDDPDSEVQRWFYLSTPLSPDVLDALHAPRNVTLKLLGLQKWEKSIKEGMFMQTFNMVKFVMDNWG